MMPTKTVNILVPRNNTRDVLAIEVMLSALADDARDLRLRLVGQAGARHFQIQGTPSAVANAQALLRHAYPQCDFEEEKDDDSAWRLRGLGSEAATIDDGRPSVSSVIRRQVYLKLREPAYLPIRTAVSRDGRITNDDLAQGADPMLGVLAAMDGLQEAETCAVDISLKPMPGDWGKYWRGTTSDVGERVKFTPQALAAVLLLSGGGMLMMFGTVFLVAAVALRTSVIPGLIGVSLITFGAVAIYLRFRLPSPPDPVLIKQKTSSTAFRVCIQLAVTATSEARAQHYLAALVVAYRAYNLSGGNGFVALKDTPHFREQDWPILNTAELAAVWHLPHGAAALQGIATTTAKSLTPPIELTRETNDGSRIRIGEALHQGQRQPVVLSRATLSGNIGLIAKTQSGKSNLMALIASQVIAQDPDTAVIVLDPHRRLAESIASLVPPARQDKTIFLSLADRAHPFGLNLLDRLPPAFKSDRDRSSGNVANNGSKRLSPNRAASRLKTATEMFADKMTSDIIETLREIWTDNWGPRMENYLRWPLLTLAYANERLVADYAFTEWRLTATQVMTAIHPHLMEGKLNTEDYAMLGDIAARFAGLERPSRITTGRLYDTLVEPVQALQVSHGTITASDSAARQLAIGQLFERVLEATKSGDKPSGISRRLYGPKERPLQFTLLDVMPLQMSSVMRTEVRGALSEARFQHIHEWWRNSFEMFRALNLRLLLDMITPVLTKLDRFAASDVARRIFGQPDSTLDIGAVLDDGGILLIDLAAGVVGQDTAALIGSTLMNWIASLLFARQHTADDGRQTAITGQPSSPVSHPLPPNTRKVLIVIDEFQSLPGVDYAFMLSELGKYGAQLMMGTQSLGFLEQINAKTRTAWLDNTNTLFVFRCGGEDARTLAAELSITDYNPLTLSQSDIVGLPDYTCYVRSRDGHGRQQVFQVRTQRLPEGDPSVLRAVQDRSRQDHCRSADEADRLIALAQSFRGIPDLGVSRSAGWNASESGGKSNYTTDEDKSNGAAKDDVVERGKPNRAKVRRVKRGRANETAVPVQAVMDREEEALATTQGGDDE